MKKVLRSLIVASLCFIGVASANAQNRCVLKNDKGSQKIITYSKDMMAYQPNSQSVCLVTNPEVNPPIKSTAPTYTLNIYPPTDSDYHWQDIWVSNGVKAIAYLWNGMADSLTVDVEEGIYYVSSSGINDSGEMYVWTQDDIQIHEDTNINVDYNDCTISINMDIEDENSNSLSDMEFIDLNYHAFLTWQNSVTYSIIVLGDDYFDGQIPHLYFNGFNEGSSLYITIDADPGDQKSYLIRCPDIMEMHESPTLTVHGDEMIMFQEGFAVRNDYDTHYYHTDSRTIINDEGAWIETWGWSSGLVFDPSKPYTIVTNGKANNPSSFETGSKTFILPRVHEMYDWENYSFPKYYDRIGSSLYINGNGELVREAMPFFQEGAYLASFPNWFPETPSMKITSNDKIAFFGERTPLATYYPVAFNANNTPFNQTFFYGGFFFSGENSCERTCDYDTKIRIYINNESVYNDSIYKFNYNENLYQFDAPANVSMDVINTHLIANEVMKLNLTHVEFDLEKDDAMPPTMTFLRVLDSNGDESVYHDNLSQSTLVFGCADFTYHFVETEWGGNYDHLEYNARPEVEVLCSVDGENWDPLIFTEDDGLFHIDYGNVFVADLGQLENRALNQWVSLQFILTDEAGNSQTQLMQNVFFAGEIQSVNKHIVNSLQHTVYPNPFNGEVRITAAQPVNGVANIVVYNVLGEQVYSKAENCTETQDFTIDGSAWKPGVYFYSINTEDGVLQGKIVKE